MSPDYHALTAVDRAGGTLFIAVPYLSNMMTSTANRDLASAFMQDFAVTTGLKPIGVRPSRYLWTDAFAVCTYLGLFLSTGDAGYRELALRLVDQVHHTLGRHRDDDRRTGWISGLPAREGEAHPTAGGLRIGKSLPERGPGERYDEQREWDQDGQYYHYLTKWMHALTRAGRVTGDPVYGRWAVELARTAQSRFTYRPLHGGRRRMYWKMSIDLTRPLVPSMGQHDPLDGLVTCLEVQMAAGKDAGPAQPVLAEEIAELADIGRDLPLATADPLGIGGLLFDASRIVRLTVRGGPVYPGLLERVIGSALAGLASVAGDGSLDLPAGRRLAFRELGLSIGLAGVEEMSVRVGENPDRFDRAGPLSSLIPALVEYVPLRETIEGFWLEDRNRESATWTEHREINTVMLATSLAPDGFQGI